MTAIRHQGTTSAERGRMHAAQREAKECRASLRAMRDQFITLLNGPARDSHTTALWRLRRDALNWALDQTDGTET